MCFSSIVFSWEIVLGNKLASVRAMRTVVPMDCDVCHSRYFNAGTFCIWSKIHQVQLEMWKVSWFCCLVVFSAVVFMDFPHFALYQSREKEPAGAIGNARNFAEKFHPRGNFHRRTAGWKSWGNFRERIVILCSSSGSRESNNATVSRNMLPQIRFPSCFPLFPQSWRESKRQMQMPVSGWGGRGDGNAGCWHFPTSFIMHRLAGPTPAIVRSTGTPLTFCRCKKNLDGC